MVVPRPILITGGTGFLGLTLVRLLVGRGKHVRLLVRANSSRLGLDSDLIEFVRGDVTDAASVRAAMFGCEQVYHLAAWVQISPWGWDVARQTNVEGTRHVCSAALELGVRRVVHTSSIATIATGTMSDPADEGTACDLRARTNRTPYYRSKRAAEKVVLDHVRRGLDAVIVNPTYLVGPWDVKPSSGRILIHTATGRLPLYPSRGGVNCADVGQVAAGHVLAMERGKTGARYILGGENLSFKSYLSRIAVVARVPAPRIGVPYAALYPFAATGSILGRVLPRLFRDVNLCVLNSAFLEHYVRSERAARELAYEITSIDRAIEDGIRWFVEYGYMKRVSGVLVPGKRGVGRVKATEPLEAEGV